jgi:transcriptional regulator with XRE-family HTH domain
MGDPRHAKRKTIAANIRRFREEAGLGQEELARLANVSTTSVSRVENDRSIASYATLDALGKVLGRTTDEFLMEDPPERKAKEADTRVAFNFIGQFDPDIAARVREAISALTDEQRARIRAAKAVGRRGKKL